MKKINDMSIEEIDRHLELQKDERFRVIEQVKSDIQELEEWSKEIELKLKYPGALISTRPYLEVVAIHILLVSKLEYLLKAMKEIEDQREIPEYIERSPLTKKEKHALLRLFLRRHPLIHNDGNPDKKFHKNLDDKGFGYMKKEFPIGSSSLTTSDSRYTTFYTNVIRKIIDKDLMKKFNE